MISLKLIKSKDFFEVKILNDENRALLQDLESTKETMYSRFTSANDIKLRTIDAVKPKSPLYILQRNLLTNFLKEIAIPNEVNGFVQGASYRTYLLPHIRQHHQDTFYLRLDIKGFFDSITPKQVKDSLSEYIKVDNEAESKQILTDINTICFLDEQLPTGAITSPALSNIFFRRADLRIRKYCRKLDITYTRYADDMLFSHTKNLQITNKLIQLVKVVLRDLNLQLNHRKTMKTKNMISLNGFVVSHELSISRKKLAQLKKVLFLLESKKYLGNSEIINILNDEFHSNLRLYFKNTEKLHNYLAGYRSFLLSWMPQNKSKWHKHCNNTIKRIEEILLNLNT